MIIDIKGNKISPKEKAKEIIRYVMERIESSSAFEDATEDNTAKEKEKIKVQLSKIKERIAKIVKAPQEKKE